ncbi:hypothetical protein K449DRAFT_433627 [Hypoxylon sp. EC38]|nr:hypothetical protein K449DRAFT_433627 [Hypoxylon sp. EC38]
MIGQDATPAYQSYCIIDNEPCRFWDTHQNEAANSNSIAIGDTPSIPMHTSNPDNPPLINPPTPSPNPHYSLRTRNRATGRIGKVFANASRNRDRKKGHWKPHLLLLLLLLLLLPRLTTA